MEENLAEMEKCAARGELRSEESFGLWNQWVRGTGGKVRGWREDEIVRIAGGKRPGKAEVEM